MAPVKCEGNLRTHIEIKQEQCDDEETHGESYAEHLVDSPVVKPSSSSLSAAEREDNYEFLGHMKYEADEATDLTANEPLSGKKRDICPICQLVYNTKPGTYYGDHRKREFVAHLVKMHDYNHLRGYCRRIQCKSCKLEKERWAFVVIERNDYEFSDVCNRCQEGTCRPITDDSDVPCPKSHSRGSITSLWKNFMAHQALNAELQECPEATTETAAKQPGVQADEATGLTTTEHPSRKKRDGNVCHLCKQAYCKRSRYGKQQFVAHLVKAHNYRHLRGHRTLTYCRSCNIGKERWSFVVREGDDYKFSDKCSTCQGNNRSGAWMASQWKNLMAQQDLSPELRESPDATAEIPADAE